MLLLVLPASAADRSYSVRFEGHARSYIVHTPPAYDRGGAQLPLIVALHGGGGSAAQLMKETNLNLHADRAGMIVVYPDGVPAVLGDLHTWNAGNCCGRAKKVGSDDVRFLSGVIDDVVAKYHADPRHVFVTGISNGAQMAYRLACERPEKIAALAPVSGQTYPCERAAPVAVLHLHGTLDRCIPYEGGAACGGCFSEVFGLGSERDDHWACAPVESSLAALARSYGCEEATEVSAVQGPMTCRSWRGCPARGDVTLCRIEGGGHGWQGAAAPVLCEKHPDSRSCRKLDDALGPRVDVDASKAIVDFFSRHRD